MKELLTSFLEEHNLNANELQSLRAGCSNPLPKREGRSKYLGSSGDGNDVSRVKPQLARAERRCRGKELITRTVPLHKSNYQH